MYFWTTTFGQQQPPLSTTDFELKEALQKVKNERIEAEANAKAQELEIEKRKLRNTAKKKLELDQ